MSLFEELVAESKNTGRPKCSLHYILRDFPPEQVNDLLKALADTSNITSAALARKLQSLGFNVSELTLARHRRHACSC